MTLKSFPNNDEEMAATASTSAPPSTDGSMASRDLSDAFPIPFFDGGRKEVVMHTDEGKMVAELPGDMFSNTNVNIKVKDSPMTEIGNQVKIVADAVTINNFPNPNSPAIQNFREKIECTGNDRTQRSASPPNRPPLQKWKHLLIPFSIFLLLLLTLISLFVYKDFFMNLPPSFPPFDPNTTKFIDGHPFFSKANWGALPEKNKSPSLPAPVSVVIICHTVTQSCSDFSACANQTQWVQYGFLKNGYGDIGYNFLVGGDGGIYEGRGWDRQNSIRDKSITVSFIGDFNKELLVADQRMAAKALIKKGVRLGKLDGDYKLIGENQTSPLKFYSPGFNAFKEIKRWDHFFSGTML